MSRLVRVVLPVLLAVAGALATTGAAAAAAPVPCEGTVQLTGTSNTQAATAGTQVVVSFDFTGLHDVCLLDGSVVTGEVSGRLTQRTAADGDMSLRFDEVLTYEDGTLGYRGEAGLANGTWESTVQTVGEGTGVLAGVHGQGTFWFTGPTSLADVIAYVYAG